MCEKCVAAGGAKLAEEHKRLSEELEKMIQKTARAAESLAEHYGSAGMAAAAAFIAIRRGNADVAYEAARTGAHFARLGDKAVHDLIDGATSGKELGMMLNSMQGITKLFERLEMNALESMSTDGVKGN